MFDKVLESKISELWNLFSLTGGLNHKGEKGGFREEFVKQLLESLLPSHFGIGSGVVVDKWDRQSPQVDLVIYDRRNLPPLLEKGGHGVYPIDSVLRVLEVKSIVDRSALEQYFKQSWCFNPANHLGLKLATAGNLEGGQAYYPLCGLFGFQTATVDFARVIDESKGENTSGIIYLANKAVINIREGYVLDEDGLVEGLKVFVVLFISALEETAQSRKVFSPSDWFNLKPYKVARSLSRT